LILLCAKIVGGFRVDSFFAAFIFSIVLSLLQSVMYGLIKDEKNK
jgi:putative membrane protein